MSRNEEYKNLLAELESVPAELEYTVEKAVKRKTALQKKRRAWGISCGSIAACFTAFVLLVNLSVPFARACGSIPVLRELAKAVAWSPSLSAAVENQYVQPIGQSQTVNGITATVEYVIVDRKQVNIFYTLESRQYGQLVADSCITLPGDEGGYSSGSSSYGVLNGELRSVRVDFIDRDVPDTLDLTLSVWDGEPEEPAAYDIDMEFENPVREPDCLAELTFTLTFDPCYTAQGQIIPVDTRFTMNGQTFTLTEAELYPTHLRVNLEDDAGNTAWLTALELYLENEYGERFYASTNGISATGDADGEGYGTFWLVSFAAPIEAEHRMYSLFESCFYTEDGGEGTDIMQVSSTYGVEDPVTGERRDGETMFTESFPLTGFHGGVVYLDPLFDAVTEFDAAIAIPIK